MFNNISGLNMVVTMTKLTTDRPDLDPAFVTQMALMSGLMPGVLGLMVPFIVESRLDDPPTTPDSEQDKALPSDHLLPPAAGSHTRVTVTDGSAKIADNITTIQGGTATLVGSTTITGGTVTTEGGITTVKEGAATIKGGATTIKGGTTTTSSPASTPSGIALPPGEIDKIHILETQMASAVEGIKATDTKVDTLAKQLEGVGTDIKTILANQNQKLPPPPGQRGSG